MKFLCYLKSALITALSAIALVSCASGGMYRDPASSGIPESELAILEHPNPTHSQIIITYVDGKYRGLGIIDRYLLSPGKHTIRASGGIAKDPKPGEKPGKSLITGGYYDLEFNAESGKTYTIGIDFFQDEMKYYSYIKEKSTGKIVSTLKAIK